MSELKSKKEIIIVALNEQLDQLCRMQIDQDFFLAMTLTHPADKDYEARLKKNTADLEDKKKLVEICRKHLKEAEAEERPN